MTQPMTERFTLPNGLRLVAERLPYLRSVSIGVWMHVGALMELPEENGMTHFIEHMVFKGTEHRTTRQIAEEMDAHGGQINAFTSREITCFYARVIDEDLPLAVDMLSDLTLHAAFPPDELEKERGVVLEEIAMDEDDPEDLVCELTHGSQFSGHPLGQPILGTAELVSSFSRDALLLYRRRHYAPERCVVSVCGNYDTQQLLALVERYFGGWVSEADVRMPEPPVPRTGRFACREKDTEQLHLCLGFPGLPYGHGDTYAQAVLNTVLGGGMSSRLFQRVREELGMAYSIYSYTASSESAGTLNIYAGVSPRNGRQVLEEIQRVTAELLRGGLTEKEFTEAKNQLRVGFLLGLESPGGRMQSMGRSLLLRNDVRTPDQVLALVDRVTLADVQSVAERSLALPPCLSVVGKGAGDFRPA